jgi:hypothetical protein
MSNRQVRCISLLSLVCVLSLLGCKSAYYSTWEKFGVYKRDLLKKRVVAARDDQQAASNQFKDALTRLKDITHFEGGELEKVYNSIKADYEKSNSRAEKVRSRIKDVEEVAADLFREWDKEIQEISTPSLRDKSREQLRTTRDRYDQLHTALKRAESSMEPVLTRLHDQVLFLKHNLNASAIASLKGETINIQNEIGKLIEDMNRAVAEADKFIGTLE